MIDGGCRQQQQTRKRPCTAVAEDRWLMRVASRSSIPPAKCMRGVDVPSPMRYCFPPTALPRMNNFLVSATLGTEIDLHTAAHTLINTVYSPPGGRCAFPAVIVESRDLHAWVAIFANGAITCTGTNTVELARLACRRCARRLKVDCQYGDRIRFGGLKVTNAWASAELLFPLSLKQFAECTGENVVFKLSFN